MPTRTDHAAAEAIRRARSTAPPTPCSAMPRPKCPRSPPMRRRRWTHRCALNAAGTLAVAVDPLDGSGNAAIGATLGSIFSILPAAAAGPASCSPGTAQRAAGLALFGPQTLLVLSVGEGTDAFVLDAGRFVLARPRMHVSRQRPEFAVNASNHRHWEPAARAYVDDCLAGRAGPLGVDYNHRWLGCVAAEAYRVLVRGGLYLYPARRAPGRRARPAAAGV